MTTYSGHWSSYGTFSTGIAGTALNALANGSNKLGSEIDLSSTKDFMLDLQLDLASINNSSASNPSVYVWVIKALDGTNYEDGADSVTPPRQPDAIIGLRALSSGAQKVTFKGVLASPTKIKLLLQNNAGVAFASDNNTILSYRVINLETVG